MKKVRLACIMLGVFLILAGMMSGLGLAQTEQVQSITFEEFLKSPESFVGKEVELTSGAVLSIRKTGLKDSPHDAYLTVTRPAIALREMPWREITKGPRSHFTIIHLPSSLLATKEGKEVGGWKIVTVKGVVEVITKKELERFEKKTLSGTVTTLDEMIKIQVYSEFIRARSCRAKKIDKIYWIEASEIKVTGRLPRVLYKQKEVLQGKTVAIPDYENFPYKHHDFNKIDYASIDQYVYVREFESTDKRITMKRLMEDVIEDFESQDKQIASVTLKDVIIINKTTVEDSFSDTTLIWIPEDSISVLEITSDYIVVKSVVGWEDLKSAARFATKENGQWKFIDFETLQAKGEEFRQKYREKLKESEEK